jgi:hypothetical protein
MAPIAPTRVSDGIDVTTNGRLQPPRVRRPRLVVRLAVCAVLAVIVGGIVAAFAASGTPHFESRASILFDQPNAVGASGDEGVILKLMRLRIKYADLVATDPLVTPTAEALGVPPSAVRGRVRAVLPPQSLLLHVIARGGSPEDARALAAASASSLRAYAADEQKTLPPNERIVLTVVSQPGRGVEVGASGPGRRLALGLLAAGVVFVLVYVVLEAGDGWRRKG